LTEFELQCPLDDLSKATEACGFNELCTLALTQIVCYSARST
jgi:hypothetical protein